jgi:hypothetical protein
VNEIESNAEDYETERAFWFIRLFYNREPEDGSEVLRLRNLFKGLSSEKLLFFASHLPDFHREAKIAQNVMWDSLVRKRIEYIIPGRVEKLPPNAFIIGQPRTGTTSLHEYFADHPDVFVPVVKETNYYSHWSEAFHGKGGLRYEDYLMYFMDAADELIRCDISPFYLSEPGAALRIYRDSPRAKVIAILRDPIDLIVSKYNLDHSDANAEIDIWIRRGLAQYGDNGPRWSHDSCVTTLFHCDISACLSEYLRYFRQRMKICMFEEMIEDQQAAYEGICDFLEIPFVYHRQYWSWRSPGTSRPSEAVLRELAAFLLPMVKRTEAMIGRDLSRWYSRWTW